MDQRRTILLGAAKGLGYLHLEEPPVVHHDVNSYVIVYVHACMCSSCAIILTYRSNILLDENLTAKIADFGFSIQMPQHYGNKTLITVGPGHGLPGTPGYRPPEYNDGRYCTKSDVYSYGVVSIHSLSSPKMHCIQLVVFNTGLFTGCS